MKKKTLILIVVGVVILIGIIAGGIYLKNNGAELKDKWEKTKTGYEVFGKDTHSTGCSGHGGFSLQVITNWNCKICGKMGVENDSNVPVICSDCAEKTGRCQWCGKLIK